MEVFKSNSRRFSSKFLSVRGITTILLMVLKTLQENRSSLCIKGSNKKIRAERPGQTI
jgi:hypothetical protein